MGYRSLACVVFLREIESKTKGKKVFDEKEVENNSETVGRDFSPTHKPTRIFSDGIPKINPIKGPSLPVFHYYYGFSVFTRIYDSKTRGVWVTT